MLFLIGEQGRVGLSIASANRKWLDHPSIVEAWLASCICVLFIDLRNKK